MAQVFTVKERTFYEGRLYNPGDTCDEKTASALGLTAEEGEAPETGDEKKETKATPKNAKQK